MLVLDVSAEMGAAPFGKAHPGSRLDYVKTAVRHFAHIKRTLNPCHRLALVIMHEQPEWVCSALICFSLRRSYQRFHRERQFPSQLQTNPTASPLL